MVELTTAVALRILDIDGELVAVGAACGVDLVNRHLPSDLEALAVLGVVAGQRGEARPA